MLGPLNFVGSDHSSSHFTLGTIEDLLIGSFHDESQQKNDYLTILEPVNSLIIFIDTCGSYVPT